MTDDLTRLALAAGRGDAEAAAEFVRRSHVDVWRLCAALASRAEADDLVQDTFVRALPALARFRGESSARTWLFTIARRTVVDSIRRTTRLRRVESSLDRRIESTPGPDHVVIDGLVAGLDTDRREAFVLTQLLGLGYAEAADVIGCPIGTIRSRVARARQHLIEAMSDGREPTEAGERLIHDDVRRGS